MSFSQKLSNLTHSSQWKITQECVNETLLLVRQQIAAGQIRQVLENPDVLTMTQMIDLGLGVEGTEITNILCNHYEDIEAGLPYTAPTLRAILILLCCTTKKKEVERMEFLKRVVRSCVVGRVVVLRRGR